MRLTRIVPLLVLAVLTLVLAARGAGGQKHTVSIDSGKFSPATLTIKAGDTVVWTNNDDHDHSISAGDGSFKSGNLSGGQAFEHTFTKAGKYTYTCAYHPRERGTIIVTQ